MSAITLTRAHAGDAARIACLSRDSIEAGLGWSWRAASVLCAIDSDDHLVVVARDLREPLAGFGILKLGAAGDAARPGAAGDPGAPRVRGAAVNDTQSHLVLLAVQPACWRQGLGRRLVAWLESCALAAGMATVALEVRASNDRALQFYAALGYRETGHLPGYYQGREAAIQMQRRIGHADQVDNAEGVRRRLRAIQSQPGEE